MADLSSITAVRPTANTRVQTVTYGATIAVGQSVYLDPADNEWKLADCDDTATTAGERGVAIAITPGVDGGQGLIATGGSIILVGASMTVGTQYIVSDTAGGIKPEGDKSTGDRVTNLGNAASATQLDLNTRATGNQVP